MKKTTRPFRIQHETEKKVQKSTIIGTFPTSGTSFSERAELISIRFSIFWENVLIDSRETRRQMIIFY